MAYKAKKLCRFDRQYLTGEIVPCEVIDPKRIESLQEMGVLEFIDDTINQGDKANDVIDEFPAEAAEEDSTTTEEQSTEECFAQEQGDLHSVELSLPTEEELMEMKKDQLLELAAEVNAEADSKMNKKDIAELIIAHLSSL